MTPEEFVEQLERSMGNVEQAMEHYVALHQAAASERDAWLLRMEQAKERVAEIFIENPDRQKWRTGAGIAMIVRPSVRASYDRKALDNFCLKRPDISALITPFRKETMVAGSLRIEPLRVAKEEVTNTEE